MTSTDSAARAAALSHRDRSTRWNAYRDRVTSTGVAVRSCLRCLPLLLAARPKTPLRVLCIMAFDALHVRRHSKPLSFSTHRVLAALLDFGASTNAIFDNKCRGRTDGRPSRQILAEAGLESFVDEFVQRLWELERRRPSPLDDDVDFHEVRAYREAVVRLCLGTVAATAIGHHCIEEGVRATYSDDDLKILFRIVMQCQIIDDVLDYSKDRSAGLPSFLTGSPSLPEAMQLTHQAACAYADGRDLSRSDDRCPLRLALFVGSACAKLIVHLGRWRCGRLEPVRDPS